MARGFGLDISEHFETGEPGVDGGGIVGIGSIWGFNLHTARGIILDRFAGADLEGELGFGQGSEAAGLGVDAGDEVGHILGHLAIRHRKRPEGEREAIVLRRGHGVSLSSRPVHALAELWGAEGERQPRFGPGDGA